MSKGTIFIVIIFASIIIEILDFQSTLYCNSTLSTSDYIYETNFWVKKFELGFLGLAIVMASYLVLNSLLFFYSNFIYRISYPKEYKNKLLRKVYYYLFAGFKGNWIIHFIKSCLNFSGYYYIRHSLIGKLFWVINNYLLGIINNNSTIINEGNEVSINLSQNIDWTSYINKVALDYFKYIATQKNGNEFIMNTTSVLASILLIYFFFRREFIKPFKNINNLE